MCFEVVLDYCMEKKKKREISKYIFWYMVIFLKFDVFYIVYWGCLLRFLNLLWNKILDDKKGVMVCYGFI